DVHGGVGAPHERLDVTAVVGIQHAANARFDLDWKPVEEERRLERGCNPVSDLHQRPFVRDLGKEKCELVSTEAGEAVAVAHESCDAKRELAQKQVPGLVPEAVV